jgi:hypothetical protein
VLGEPIRFSMVIVLISTGMSSSGLHLTPDSGVYSLFLPSNIILSILCFKHIVITFDKLKAFKYYINKNKMSAKIVIYENGLDRNLDSYNSEEIRVITVSINSLIGGDYTVDLYSGYVFNIDKFFVNEFCSGGEMFPLDILDNTQVSFILEDEDESYLCTITESDSEYSD